MLEQTGNLAAEWRAEHDDEYATELAAVADVVLKLAHAGHPHQHVDGDEL